MTARVMADPPSKRLRCAPDLLSRAAMPLRGARAESAWL